MPRDMSEESMTFEQFIEYGTSDVAGTHRRTTSRAVASLDPAIVDADWTRLQADGYVVLENLLSERDIDEIKIGVVPLLGKSGRNPFEGLETQRVYNVIEKTRIADRVVEHPRILALLDRLFLPNYLLSQLQIIRIDPSEAAQVLHTDDAFYPVPRPRPPLGAASVFAIDDFTEDNGATRLIAGSHLWGDARIPSDQDDATPAVMPAGSAVFFLGTTWHGGGCNRTDQSRLAISGQYCEPWVRQQENYSLGVSRETARTVSEDMQRMLGYSIHPPFMGMVNGMSPKQLLGERD